MLKTEKPQLINNYWYVTRHADCKLVLDDENSTKKYYAVDPENAPFEGWFGSERHKDVLRKEAGESYTDIFITEEQPEGTILAGIFTDLVSHNNIESIKNELHPLVEKIISSNLNNKNFDLVNDLIYKAAPIIYSGVYGNSELKKRSNEFERHFNSLLSSYMNAEWVAPYPPGLLESSENAIKFFSDMIAEILIDYINNPRPNDDFIQRLFGLYGDNLHKIGQTIVQTGTTSHVSIILLKNIYALLCSDKDLQNKLRKEEKITPSHIEEFVRIIPSKPIVFRVLTKDLTIDDIVMKKGMIVVIDLNAACFDPEVFDNPYVFDSTRKVTNNLGYSYGAHACMGRYFSKSILSMLVEELLNNTTEIELVGEIVSEQAGTMTIPNNIPVLLKG